MYLVLYIFPFYKENHEKDKTRVEKAMELAWEHLDYIIDHRTAPNFVEVTGRV